MIQHDIVCDLAGLTLLVYEYGKSFIIDNNKTIETFISEINNINHPIVNNELYFDIMKDFASSSPKGKVYKFYNIYSSDLQVGITISEINKRICIIFRGTESKLDWLYDLSVLKTHLHDNIYVHSGFYKQLHHEFTYNHLKIDLLWLINEYPNYDIYISGHSLGGALATLFGYEISFDIDKKINIISFASPRVGNYEFKKSFENKINLNHYRISNDQDIGTAVPIINYYHVGKNISLNNNSYSLNLTYNIFKFSLFYCWKIKEHYMELYFKRLKKITW